jgi:RNA polymerase sigma factor (sigma-70 family)
MKTQAGLVLRHVRGLVASAGGEVSDGQLLERFAVRREEAAFAALVRRHGPMVLGVCRRVLRQEQDAEDAFQVAFLVLARKAPSINKRDSIGSWLYRVAYNVAMKARERSANRQKRERGAASPQPADPLAEITGRELLEAFDEELAQLPDRQRAPLVLCYLQGLTRDAAAQQLGCSESTLHRRLDAARERLRQRLAQRGLALPVALLAVGSVAGTVPKALAASSVKTALGKATAVPAAIAALAREALRGTTGRASKAVGALLLAVGLVAATAGLVASQTPAELRGDPPRAEADAAKPPVPARPAEPVNVEKPDLTVKGTVVDADGKPVAGARVAVIALVEQPYRGRVGQRGHKILASGEADKEGRFRLDCAPATPSPAPTRQLLASAPGHGLGWLDLPRDADKADLKIKLPAEQVIRGRLLDLQGQAAGGVKLHVAEVLPTPHRGSVAWNTGGTSTSSRATPVASAPPLYDFPAQPAKLDVWPAAVTTDDDGRFVVRGLGKDQGVTLLVTDERFAPQRLVVSTAAKDKPEAVERPLESARWLEGQVVGEDTGKPIGKKVLLDFSRGGELLQVWADEKGKFRVNCPPGLITIEPYPPDGSPYLTRATVFGWPKGGKTKLEIKVELPRGVLVSGKVTEADSGKPVAGAVLTYLALQDNKFQMATPWVLSWLRYPGEFVRTKDDGTFTATVYPDKGVLMAKGPTRDYVLERLDRKEFGLGDFGAGLYADGAAPLDLKAGADAPPLALKLRRGVTVKGRVLDPDGKPVKSALVCHSLSLQDQGERAYYFGHSPAPVAVKDGTFTLTGIDPKAEMPVYIRDRKNEVGGRLVVSGKSAGEDVTVKLQPCARAKVRFVDAAGKPLAWHNLTLRLLLAPDARVFLFQTGALGAWDAASPSDKDGRQTVSGLIPGATYRYFDHKSKKEHDFTAEAGKTHDLGELSPPLFGGGGAGGSPD